MTNSNNTRSTIETIYALSDNENLELQSVLHPSSIVQESRIGDNGVLQLETDYVQDPIDQTAEQISELNAKIMING